MSEDVKIKISATAELRALKQTEQALIQQITAAKAAGAAFGSLEKQLASVQGSIGNKGFIGRAQAELIGVAEKIPVVGSLMRSLNGGAGFASAGLAVLTGTVMALNKGLSEFSRIENIQTSFETLLGGKKPAKARMGELTKFAAETPFELPEVAQASKTLENLTDGALSTGKGLQMVGDVAAATNAPFTEVAVTLGRLYQGMRDGTPVGEAAARMTELTGINLRQATSWEQVAGALAKYNGEMARRSETVSGKESNFGDSFNLMMAQVGRPVAPIYKAMLSGLASGMGAISKTLSGGMDAYARDQEVLAKLRGEGDAAETTKVKVDKLSVAQESAADKAKRIADAVKQAVSPLEEMGSAAERAAGRLERLRGAQEKLAGAKIDMAQASGEITPEEADYQRVATKAAYELDANTQATSDAEAALAQAKALAEAQKPKTKSAVEIGSTYTSLYTPSVKDQAAAEEAAAVQKALDDAVASAQSRVDVLAMQRETIGLELDKGNASISEKARKKDSDQAATREALGLETQHASAVAAGDTAEAGRVKWMQDYSAALEKAKGAGIADQEGFAATSASAQFLQEKIAEKKAEPEKASFSAGHAQGRAQGEIYVPPAQNEAVAAQRVLAAKLTATNDLLQEYIRQKPVKLDQTARFEQ
jgi:hypothetical protein